LIILKEGGEILPSNPNYSSSVTYKEFQGNEKELVMLVFLTIDNTIIPIIPLKYKYYHEPNLTLDYRHPFWKVEFIFEIKLFQKDFERIISMYDITFDHEIFMQN